MSDIWGTMPKSQDDSETIEQCITRLINEHNSASLSHSLAGQSLDVHRKSEVIDHLAGSILADKVSATQRSVLNSLMSLEGWYKVGTISTDGVGAVELDVGSAGPVTSFMRDYNGIGRILLNTELDMYWQGIVRYEIDSGAYTSYFGFLASEATNAEGFGFIIRNDVLKAHVHDGTHGSEITINGIDFEAPHVYRAFYIAGEGIFYFYIDGNLVAQIAKGAVVLNNTATISLYIHTTASDYRAMHVALVDYASGQ